MAQDSDALERRIAKLESQIAALTAIISATPGGTLAITAPGGISITAGGALSLTAGSAVALTAGSIFGVTAGTRIKLAGGQDITLDSRQCHVQATVALNLSSNQSMAIEVGKKLSVIAADEATVKSGSAQIELKKDGSVTLRGRDITTTASGRVTVKSSSDTAIKGSKIIQN